MPASRLADGRRQAVTTATQKVAVGNGTKSKETKEAQQDRRNRKRAQNRISQQCIREKQLAYSKQLEALTGIIKSSTRTDRESTISHNAHMDIQMALIEENKELRDALLRMRKKMLALSSAVGAVADDPIFEHIFESKQNKGNNALHKSAAGASEDEDGRQREKSGSIAENAPSKGPRTDGDARQESALNQDGQEQDGQEQAGTDMEMQIVENPLEVSHRDELVMITTRDNAFNNPLRSPTLPFVQAGQPLSMEGSRLPIIHSQIDLDGMTLIETDTDKFPAFSSSEAPTTSVPPTFDPDSRTPTVGSSFQLRTVEAHDENIQDPFSLSNYELCYANSTATGTWSDFPATDVHYLSQFEFVPEEPRYEGPKFHVARENSWKIEKACLRYLARHYNIRGLEPASHNNRRDISQYGGLRAAIAALDCNDVVVEDVAKLAVNILCKTSGFGQYIYGVGAYKDMEKVFRWRLSPSTRNRQLISEPFQPTSLQYMGHCNYDASIDFINWASIRDQLIYKAGTYDLNQVVADIVANTVIEIPERRVAINIHDTFFTKIFARTAATCSTSDLGVRNNLLDNGISEVWESDFVGQTSLSWTTADVFSYITKQIGALNVSRKSNSDLTTFDNCHPSLYSHRLTLALAQPLATKWGLDKLYRWKLSREFAQAYPFLDCTGVTASFPMYASKTLPDR